MFCVKKKSLMYKRVLAAGMENTEMFLFMCNVREDERVWGFEGIRITERVEFMVPDILQRFIKLT